MTSLWSSWLCAALVLGAACEQQQKVPFGLKRAQFGVLFGGDVQELAQIPLETDRTRQAIGIRLIFDNPPEPPLPVHWELERPRKSVAAVAKSTAGKSGASDGGSRAEGVVEFGDVMTRKGEAVLDVPLAFRVGDPLGDWSVRVQIEGQQVLNRPFRVVQNKSSKPSGNDY